MTVRSSIAYIGAFLATASIFFSFGLLSGQYDVVSFVQETKMRAAGLAPALEEIKSTVITPEQFVNELNLTHIEQIIAQSLVGRTLGAASKAHESVVVQPFSNATGMAKTKKCRRMLRKALHTSKAQSKEQFEQIRVIMMDSIGAVIKAIRAKYTPEDPDPAYARMEMSYSKRRKNDESFHAKAIDRYIELNRESRKLEIKIPEDQKHLGPKPHEIMIFSASNADLRDPEEAELVYQALENRNSYAAYHGYQHEFLNLSRYSAAEYEHPCWLKLPAIQETLHKHPEVKWLWWLDMDAIIMNGQLKIEEHLLHPYTMKHRLVSDTNVCAVGDIFSDGGLTPLASDVDPDEIEFIFTHDYLTLNAGSFFLKNTPANKLTLDMWGDPEFIYNEKGGRKYERREQDAFINLYHRHKNVRDRTGVYVQSTMNSYDEHNGRELQRGEHGDFVFHFAGFSNQRETYLRMWKEAWDKRVLPNGEHPEVTLPSPAEDSEPEA